MSHSALTANLSFSIPSQKTRVSPYDIQVFHRLSPSTPKKPMCLSVKAIGGEGSRDNLDHLQTAPTSKMRQQQQQQSSLQQQKRRAAQPAPFGLWDRFPSARTVDQMMETMERIMDDPFAYNGASLSGDESLGSYRRGRTPWEIIEGEGEYKMRFDMPGMTKKDVKIWVEEKMLVVKAEKQAKEGDEDEEWPSKSYGRYNSRIALPDNVEVEKIKAEVKDGVLYITIPKASPSSKKLDIDVQ